MNVSFRNMSTFARGFVFTASVVVAGATTAFANHPVLVEGNCGSVPAGATAVVPGTCGDFDGDGRVGTAEDTDGADRVFGTINAALSNGVDAALGTGANQNGTVTIVTSGRFPEVVTITAANGNVTLQAAPGVEANIDAVLQGDANSGARQGQPGIIVNSPSNRYVVIRNITSRNWTSGIQINGDSRVAIQNCRLENNVNYGIEVGDRAKVLINDTQVHSSGFRASPAGNFPTANAPAPGIGIEFDDQSTGTISSTTVSGSFAAGIANKNASRSGVCLQNVTSFDNSPNFDGVRASLFGQNTCGN